MAPARAKAYDRHMRPSILNPLFADITRLNGVGPKLATLMAKVAGPRIVDLVHTLPTGLIDRSYRPALAEATTNAVVTLSLHVDRHEPPPNRRQPYRVVCSDESGFVTLCFFHARSDYLQRVLPEGTRRLVSGKLESYNGGLQITHPDHIVDPDKADGLPLFEPVYPLTAGLSGAVMGKAVRAALDQMPGLPEWQDQSWLDKNKWPGCADALAQAHAPKSTPALQPLAPARQRLAYDELLASQLALALIRRERTKKRGAALKGDGRLRRAYLARLRFAPTDAQKAALRDIFADMGEPFRMVRLLQGDVGSGKTLVAMLAMLASVEAGHQAVLMAPTEILARQHLDSLSSDSEAIGIRIDILTGRDKGLARAEKLTQLADGTIDILLGTHAVFQERVDFARLGLVVVDEQHRFGVHQRMALTAKGLAPDLLVMTATPIPRTLALTTYGDMDVSIIAEKPPGRKPITTRTIPLERLDDVVAAASRAIDRGEQLYWVCPLVEESDMLALTAAQDRYETLHKHFGDRVGLVHGRMAAAEKDRVMAAFQGGALSILVATTVIEVGVNAPNATVIVIEHAERFGLAQLHQLRGRVGRGDKPAACLLLYKGPLGETARARLQALRQSADGFALAEEDLRLRGAGDLLGTAQSGFPRYRLADPLIHADLIRAARDDANLVLTSDPDLQSDRGAALRILLYLFQRDDAIRLLSAG